MEIEYGGCTEIYGYAYQDIVISCTNEKCFAQLSLSADFQYLKNNCGIELSTLWNSLGK